MKIQSIASTSVVIRDVGSAHHLYRDVLNLDFEGADGDYLFTESLEGSRHFGLWPLREAARACFGEEEWPAGIAVPQASVEFETADESSVAAAAQELQAAGYTLLHDAKTEPWGQIITRLTTPEGLIIGVSYTPWFHEPADTSAAAE